jgi:hypothetical protein
VLNKLDLKDNNDDLINELLIKGVTAFDIRSVIDPIIESSFNKEDDIRQALTNSYDETDTTVEWGAFTGSNSNDYINEIVRRLRLIETQPIVQTTVYVSQNGIIPNQITNDETRCFASINDALNGTPSQYVKYIILPGVYNETVITTKNNCYFEMCNCVINCRVFRLNGSSNFYDFRGSVFNKTILSTTSEPIYIAGANSIILGGTFIMNIPSQTFSPYLTNSWSGCLAIDVIFKRIAPSGRMCVTLDDAIFINCSFENRVNAAVFNSNRNLFLKCIFKGYNSTGSALTGQAFGCENGNSTIIDSVLYGTVSGNPSTLLLTIKNSTIIGPDIVGINTISEGSLTNIVYLEKCQITGYNVFGAIQNGFFVRDCDLQCNQSGRIVNEPVSYTTNIGVGYKVDLVNCTLSKDHIPVITNEQRVFFYNKKVFTNLSINKKLDQINE